MALTDSVIWLAGLCEIVLPTRTVRLCDGAFVQWGADQFTSEDVQLGTIESIEPVAEVANDEAPSGKLTMLPPEGVDLDDILDEEIQGSSMRFWLAEMNRETGAVVGDPELLFAGFLDTITLRVARSRRAIDVEFVSTAERLFATKEGNVLSPRFHQLAWPGEEGFEFATGVPSLVAWGTSGPGRGISTSLGWLSWSSKGN